VGFWPTLFTLFPVVNGVSQSEWISMTSCDSVILSLGGGVSWDDLAILVALLKLLKCLAHGVPVERHMWEPWLGWN
jgi:hypothetical protein